MMITAIKEYNQEVLMPCMKWIKRHWKGYFIYAIVCMTAPILYFLYLHDYATGLFRKESDCNEENNKEES